MQPRNKSSQPMQEEPEYYMKDGVLGYNDAYGNFIQSNQQTAANKPMGKPMESVGTNTSNNPFLPSMDNIVSGINQVGNVTGNMLNNTQPDNYEGMPKGNYGDLSTAGGGGDLTSAIGSGGDLTQAIGGAQMGDSKKTGSMDPGVAAGIGAGLGVGGTLLKTFAKDTYNQRTGTVRPNALGKVGGRAFDLAAAGANPALAGATGGLSIAIGAGLGAIMGGFEYAAEKEKYDASVRKANIYDMRDSKMSGMKPDYTYMSKYGSKVNPYLK
jgi:hypothetical protein